MTDKLLYKFVRIPDTDENVIYTADPVFRVLYDEKVKWEYIKPFNFQWDFEQAIGNFPDNLENLLINRTDSVNSVPSIHAELDDAIEIDYGVSILSSGVYPIYATDAINVNVTQLGDFQTYKGFIEGLDIAASLGDFELRGVLLTYNDGDPEGIDVSASLGNFDMPSVIITYNDGDPEGIDVSASLGNFDMPVVVITYNDGDPEGIDVSASLGNFELI